MNHEKLTLNEYNLVEDNLIGTDRTGKIALGNQGEGIIISEFCNYNIIRDNLISGGKYVGVIIQGNANEVKGNLIGTDITGTQPLGNGDWGVLINGSDNVIGGMLKAERNVLSGNYADGVVITGDEQIMNNNRIIGNYIGTDITGKNPIPNNTGAGCSGMGLGGNARNSLIEGNLIAYNLRCGILIGQQNETSSAFGNRFTKNSIYLNEGLGIDLGNNGITPNDIGDLDTGDNNLMNYPVLTSAKVTSGKLHVKGTIDTQNPKTVTIEFFANPVPTPGGDPSGYGEGAIYLGSDHPNPHGKINATLPTVAPGTLITATATDAAGNTSEFSAYIEAK